MPGRLHLRKGIRKTQLYYKFQDKEADSMAKWYEEAVFYHIYPIGLQGRPGRTGRQR